MRGTSPHPLSYTGVNLSGAEFGNVTKGKASIYGKDYTYPTSADFKYFATKGCNIVRLPFLWERLQPDLSGPFDPNEESRLKSVVGDANKEGLTVILDIHNYARYFGRLIGSTNVPNQAFATLWRHLANDFKLRLNP